jgi:hypothetical protein
MRVFARTNWMFFLVGGSGDDAIKTILNSLRSRKIVGRIQVQLEVGASTQG